MHLYRTTVTMILANFTASLLNESQMEISVRNFHLKKRTCRATQEKQTISGPRAQLNKLLECCGKPELSRESVACEDGSVKVKPVDSNNTMDKVLGAQESLVEQFAGEDLGLRDEVIEEARRQVELELKAEMRTQQKNSGTAAEKEGNIKTGPPILFS